MWRDGTDVVIELLLPDSAYVKVCLKFSAGSGLLLKISLHALNAGQLIHKLRMTIVGGLQVATKSSSMDSLIRMSLKRLL